MIGSVISLVDPRSFREFWRVARPQFGVAAVTFASTLALAPHIEQGVLIGVGCAVAVHLWRESHVTVVPWREDDVLHIRPQGILYFGSAHSLEASVSELIAAHPDVRGLEIHLDALGRIDLTGATSLRGLVTAAAAAGIKVRFRDVPPQARRIIEGIIVAPAISVD